MEFTANLPLYILTQVDNEGERQTYFMHVMLYVMLRVAGGWGLCILPSLRVIAGLSLEDAPIQVPKLPT